MMAFGKDIAIGDLRDMVILATRTQSPDLNTSGIEETYTNQIKVWANIKPLGLQTWINSEQIDSPITHRITLRWMDEVDMFDVVLREIRRQDGTHRQEIFRVRKVGEWNGRQRFSVLDVEIERRG